MPKGPKVHEIFSNQSLERNSAFKYEGQESKTQVQLSKKTMVAPMPPMKKFGGYKPKILGGENTDDLVTVPEATPHRVLSTPMLKKANHAPGPPKVQLTKPKPFVIGDKDVPMVLSVVGDNDFEGHNGNDNVRNGLEDEADDLHIYNTVIRNDDHENRLESAPSLEHMDTSTLIPHEPKEDLHGWDNSAMISDEPPAVDPLSLPAFEVHVTSSFESQDPPLRDLMSNSSSYPTDVYSNGQGQGEPETESEEPVGVFIPSPDYDEEEKTMEFAEEDTDASDGAGEEERMKQKRNKLVHRMYDGEDLSRYLSDDEDAVIENVNVRNQKPRNRKPKSEPKQPKTMQKHMMFNQQTASKTTGKRKSSGKAPAPAFNSVRSFSYADSKFGTRGRAENKAVNLTFSEFTDESAVFADASQPEDSYEMFLRSRHGDAIPAPPPESSDSGVDMADEASFAHLRRKGDPLWKKLTFRLKNKMSKNYSMKEY